MVKSSIFSTILFATAAVCLATEELKADKPASGNEENLKTQPKGENSVIHEAIPVNAKGLEWHGGGWRGGWGGGGWHGGWGGGGWHGGWGGGGWRGGWGGGGWRGGWGGGGRGWRGGGWGERADGAAPQYSPNHEHRALSEESFQAQDIPTNENLPKEAHPDEMMHGMHRRYRMCSRPCGPFFHRRCWYRC